MLGNHEKLLATLDAVNRILFGRTCEVILSATTSNTRQTWMFLNEIRDTKKIGEGLSRLLTKGRSKGASVALASQGIEGIRDAFGEKVAEEFVSQCSHVSFLGLNSVTTAKWASEIIGRYERTEVRRSNGPNGDSVQEQVVNRDTVMPTELLGLPSANPRNGICGYHLAPDIGAWFARIPGAWITQALMPAASDVPDFIPRPPSHQYLRAWDEHDLARLKLEPEDGDPVAARLRPPSPLPPRRLKIAKATS